MTYSCPDLDGYGRETTLVGDHEYFIPTTFHQNRSSGSGEEVENVKGYGRRAMTIAHLNLWLTTSSGVHTSVRDWLGT